jgi:hypothetical protein
MFKHIIPSFLVIDCLCLGIFMLSRGFSNYQAAAEFENNSLPSIGTITETSVTSDCYAINYGSSCRNRYSSTVQFKTQAGKSIEAQVNYACNAESLNLCKGQKVQMIYAIDNPKLSMVEGEESPADIVRNNIMWGVIFMAFIPFLAIEFLKPRKA